MFLSILSAMQRLLHPPYPESVGTHARFLDFGPSPKNDKRMPTLEDEYASRRKSNIRLAELTDEASLRGHMSRIRH